MFFRVGAVGLQRMGDGVHAGQWGHTSPWRAAALKMRPEVGSLCLGN